MDGEQPSPAGGATVGPSRRRPGLAGGTQGEVCPETVSRRGPRSGTRRGEAARASVLGGLGPPGGARHAAVVDGGW